MIRVISHGIREVFGGVCSKCGASIECDREDILKDSSSTGQEDYVICPDCGEKITITWSQGKIDTVFACEPAKEYNPCNCKD